MFEYVLDRGLSEIVRGGYNTPQAAEKEGREEAAELCRQGLDTFFTCVRQEEEEEYNPDEWDWSD